MFRRLLPLAVVFVVGCMETAKPEPVVRETTLYDRLGGRAKIDSIASNAIDELVLNQAIPSGQRKALLGEPGAKLRVRLANHLAELARTSKKPDIDWNSACAELGMDGITAEMVRTAIEQAAADVEMVTRDRDDLVALVKR